MRRHAFPLSEAVEALHAEGYIVLTAEQGEAVTALLGEISYENMPLLGTPWRDVVGGALSSQADDILASWPLPQHEGDDERAESH